MLFRLFLLLVHCLSCHGSRFTVPSHASSYLDSEGELNTDIDITGCRDLVSGSIFYKEVGKLGGKSKHTHLDDLGKLDSLLGSALQIINGENLHARLVDDLVGLLHVGALQTGDDGDLEVEVLDSVDQTGGDGVAPYDTTKDVDEDGSHLLVAGDELKGLLDGGGGGTSTDVEEVGGLAAVELDDVHGGHGETGAVDKAANVTLELDEVEAGLSSANLLGVLLRSIAPAKDLLLPVVGVVVEAELGVHAQNLVVRGLGEGVDLDLSGVLLEEDLVQLLDGVLGVLDALLAEAQLGGDLAGNLVCYADVDVNVGCDDGFGVLLGDTLDIDTTLGGRDDNGALRGAVHEDSEVELAAGELALADVDGAAETALGASLLGDKLVADHLVGEHLGLGGRVDDANSALEAVIEGALATAASQNLRLDHHIVGSDRSRDRLGLGGRLCDSALGHSDAILRVRRVESATD